MLRLIDRFLDLTATHTGIQFTTLTGPGEYLSYHTLRERSLQWLGYLQAQDIRPGTPLIFQFTHTIDFVTAFWAALAGQYLTIPLYAANTQFQHNLLNRILEQLPDAVILTRSWSTGDYPCHIRVIAMADIPASPLPCSLSTFRPDDLAYIQYSSGTTAQPKGVMLTHGNLDLMLEQIIARIQITPSDCTLNWLPLSHDMGLVGFHLVPLACGISQHLTEPVQFLRHPVQFLHYAAAQHASLLSLPNFGVRHILKHLKSDTALPDLSKIRLIFNGAEPVSATLIHQFLSQLAPYGLSETSMFPVYGLAEATLAVSFPALNEPVRTCQHAEGLSHTKWVELGTPLFEYSVRICDKTDTPVPASTIGHIQLKGAHITSGYLHMDNTPFRTTDGWFRTRDMGFFNQGRLVLTGRDQELVIYQGQNYFASEIEQHISNSLNVSAAVISLREFEVPLAVAVEKIPVNRQETVIQDIQHLLSQTLGIESPFVWCVSKFPRTETGKLRKNQIAHDYISTFNPLADTKFTIPHNPENQAVIHHLLAALFPGVTWKPDTNFFNHGMTSVHTVSFAAQLTRLFGTPVKSDDIYSNPSISKLIVFMNDMH